MMWMSQGGSSCGVIGLPRPGPSARAAIAVSVSAAAQRKSLRIEQRKSLRIDMSDLPLGIDGPTGRPVVVLGREGEHRWRSRGLAAIRDDRRPCRLYVAGLVPGAALQHRRPA